MNAHVEDRIDLLNESGALGRPLICVPVVAADRNGISSACKAIADEPADIIEWRIDRYVDCHNYNKVLEMLSVIKDIISKPLICTFRTGNEGGADIETQEYLELINVLAKSGLADIIDVEIKRADSETMKNIIAAVRNKGSRVIASCHYFECTPAGKEMLEVYDNMADAGADILKLAVMPSDRHDVMRLLAVTELVSEKYDKPIVSMSMGGRGLISRVMGSVSGSVMTFASVGQASAPGQIPAKQMLELLELFMTK